MKQMTAQRTDGAATVLNARIPRRAGILVIEMLVALILIGTVASVLSVALHGVRILRQGERFDRLVDIELAACAARLKAEAAAGETALASRIRLSDGFRRHCPQAVLSVERVPDTLFGGELQEWSLVIRRPAENMGPESVHRLSVWTVRADEAKGTSGL